MWIIDENSIAWGTKFVDISSGLSNVLSPYDGWDYMRPESMELIRQAILEGRNYVDLRKTGDENGNMG